MHGVCTPIQSVGPNWVNIVSVNSVFSYHRENPDDNFFHVFNNSIFFSANTKPRFKHLNNS
jgi:hypothetical protein